jgi:hypothetical protein
MILIMMRSMEIKIVSNSLYEKKSKNVDPIKLAKIA